MRPLMSQLRSPDQIIDVRIDKGSNGSKGTHYSRDPTHQPLTGPRPDGHCYPPQPDQDQASQRLSHASDTSVALFTLYLRISEDHDRRKYELVKGHLDSILFFVSHYVGYYRATSPLTQKLLVRFVFCHSCGIDSSID